VTLISNFDPWRSKLCTCPPKLTFNPYTGCDHTCVYCYASSYIPKFFNCRPKKDLVPRLKREAVKLKGELISIANSSDPYPKLEAETGLMRKCLEILSKHDCKVQIVTKSNLVVRDADLLKKMRSMVTLTITTDNISKILEPKAPSSSERLKAAETLIKKGIPTSVRIDPIIPFVNDNPENLVGILTSIGVKHITSSTYKVKPDNWKRFSMALPETAEKLKPLYFEKGDRIGGYVYLPEKLRLELMEKVATLAEKHGIKFGTCREGLNHLNTATCDGSWLIK
jgi:DNA repair photolyase